MSLSADRIEEAKTVFEVFDRKYTGTVDAFYLGDMLRCLNIPVSNAACEAKGQTPKTGSKQFKIEEFLAIYQEFAALPAKKWGAMEDFMEGLKLYDKDQNGKLQLAELSTVITNMAEKLGADQMAELLAATKTSEDEDGCINYKTFVERILAGPFA